MNEKLYELASPREFILLARGVAKPHVNMRSSIVAMEAAVGRPAHPSRRGKHLPIEDGRAICRTIERHAARRLEREPQPRCLNSSRVDHVSIPIVKVSGLAQFVIELL